MFQILRTQEERVIPIEGPGRDALANSLAGAGLRIYDARSEGFNISAFGQFEGSSNLQGKVSGPELILAGAGSVFSGEYDRLTLRARIGPDLRMTGVLIVNRPNGSQSTPIILQPF